MTADMSNPKNWAIIICFWLLELVLLWKFMMASQIDLFWIKVIISVASLPIIAGIIYIMGEE